MCRLKDKYKNSDFILTIISFLYTNVCVIISADSGSDVISEALSMSPEFDLEEATRTIHVGGKWISFKSEETETTIVDVGMPNSGDFIKYFVWCTCTTGYNYN